jgi:hypothetical protein
MYLLNYKVTRSQDSSLDTTVSGLWIGYSVWTMDWMTQGSIPGTGRTFLSPPKCPGWLWGPPTRGSSQGVKQLGHEADH